MQEQIQVAIPAVEATCYPIIITDDDIDYSPLIARASSDKNIVIITDSTVLNLHAKALKNQLIPLGYMVNIVSFKAGELSKNSQTKHNIDEQILRLGQTRQTLIIALGGGVVGDIAGFIASTYMRGVNYIQMPTTLLAMIDSSVGGKTGVNSQYGKNLIGAFYQPQAVIMNLGYLTTLPKEHLVNGMVEAVKIFATLSGDDFKFLERNLDAALELDLNYLTPIITNAVRLKAHIVEKDQKEQHLRKILNFGHTLGHAIEKVSNYEILHGFAVGLGILLESQIAVILGDLTMDVYNNIAKVIDKLGIKTDILRQFAINDIIEASRNDKKNQNGEIYCTLLNGVGSVKRDGNLVVFAIKEDIIKEAWQKVLA